jgi:glycosyltransferase involved in cell wall biosynthesis
MMSAHELSNQATTYPRHICIVTETYPPEVNGVALTLSHLVKGLRERGHVVSMIRPRQRMIDTSKPPGDTSTLLVRGLPLPGYKGLQFGLPAKRTFQHSWSTNRPDAIYIATEGPLGWSAAGVAKQLGIAALSGFHTNYHSYSKHYRVGWLERIVLKYLCGFHKRTAGTLVPSEDLRARLEAIGLNNVSFLGRGVDSDRFGPQHRSTELRREWGVLPSDLAVLYVGRLAPEKNISVVIDAYRRMQTRRASMKFVIVGDGPLRGALQERNPDLIFCGMLSGEQLARHYASADIFLFASETETFGNVTLEAMASELVVVAYDYAAAKLHVRHRETGMLVPYGDSPAFAATAASLVWDTHGIQRMRRHAREYVATVRWSRVVDKFERLLIDAVEQPLDEPGSSYTPPRPMVTPRGFAIARGRV